MPAITKTDPIFTDDQEALLTGMGVAKSIRPTIEIPALVRFDAGRVAIYVSHVNMAGNIFCLWTEVGAAPWAGYVERSQVEDLRHTGRLYRADLIQSISLDELARIAVMRAEEAA